MADERELSVAHDGAKMQPAPTQLFGVQHRTFGDVTDNPDVDAGFHARLEQLRLKERRIFRIDNPLLGPETPFNDKRLWFDPQTWK